ncbi:hypothetical protein XELAEV_18027550mg [Xenopus laevis]|uniref:Uncharacterized protein n=1 Tax=Xenopus laevis TaxID=8355 RepID=A0A974CXQ5_XENLA|nr:hypothetical protein XELAEV_18027550mg [Xenopus laevis]
MGRCCLCIFKDKMLHVPLTFRCFYIYFNCIFIHMGTMPVTNSIKLTLYEIQIPLYLVLFYSGLMFTAA